MGNAAQGPLAGLHEDRRDEPAGLKSANGHLPFYNQDLEDAGDPPAAWLEFRERIKACNGLLFVTPEYNRGVPAMLKNALDVASGPYGKAAWTSKPGAMVIISQRTYGRLWRQPQPAPVYGISLRALHAAA